jgi:hypothetical protein
VQVLFGIGLLGVGLLAVLYGVFAILFEPNGGGETTVMVGDRRVDADTFGATVLVIGLAGLVVGSLLLRRRSRS